MFVVVVLGCQSILARHPHGEPSDPGEPVVAGGRCSRG